MIAELHQADAFEHHRPGFATDAVLVLDPPFDLEQAWPWAADTMGAPYSVLAFTDSRNIAGPLAAFGPPAWLFVWDTMSTWQTGPRNPLQRTKLCLWYGEHFDRDAELYGDAPPARDHPTTRQEPLDGRRLADVYTESLRWLHNPTAAGSAGSERFSERQGDPLRRHAKPDTWLRLLIGNTSTTQDVIDPFMGAGSSIRAARDLGRRALGTDINADAVDYVRQSLTVAPQGTEEAPTLFEEPAT